MDKAYIQTVRLLLEAISAVFEHPAFAMKGGTAINLFVEDMPRLSVDIDVVYTDHQAPREQALAAISTALTAARNRLRTAGLEGEVTPTNVGGEAKLFIRRDRSQVKVEVNHVFRGTVLPPERRSLGPEARRVFTTEVSAPVLARSELYGSKLVAALDRQHPRDWFDLQGMFARGGLAPEIMECFICYLAGHNRPVHEVLFSRDHDLVQAFETEFVGMTRKPITVDELTEVRRRLRRELPLQLTAKHRQFLLGLVAGQPEWQLLNCRHAAELPAIRWKLQNLARLKQANPRKFSQQAEELRERLGV
jgi:hypothetical protein